MATFPVFNKQTLQAICDLLAETSEGLTNSEVDRLLGQCQMPM